MWIPPLLILPLLMYNAIYFGWVGGQNLSWTNPVFSFDLPSGAVWGMNVGDVLVLFALGTLLIEGVRGYKTIRSHLSAVFWSGLVFAIYLGEFVFLPAAASSLFFTCLAMSFVDVVTHGVFFARRNNVQN